MAELPAIGSVVADKYRIEALLGEGGMGAVFRARHLMMDNDVALKWLHPSLSKSAEAKERFMREARAAARIRHDHVVDVYDVGVHDGSMFMVMELLEGESFEQLLAAGNISVAGAVGLLIQSMRGVAHAHRRGIVHRDIKPENIFIVRDAQHVSGIAKVLDFGISKLNDAETPQHLTQTGSTMGTPLYMSLEQMNGARDVDGRADIYAFGVILYRALTGELPFDGETFAMIAVKVATYAPPEPNRVRPELPAPLSAIVMKAMARDREQRYASMDELIEALVPFGPAQAGASSLVSAEDVRNTLGVAPSSVADVGSVSDLELAKSASVPSESFQVPTPIKRAHKRTALLAGAGVLAALGAALLFRAVSPAKPGADSLAAPKPPRPPAQHAAATAQGMPDKPSNADDWAAPNPTPPFALGLEGGSPTAPDAGPIDATLTPRPTRRARPGETSATLPTSAEARSVTRKPGERASKDKTAPPTDSSAPAKPHTAQGQRSGTLSRDEFR